MHRKSLKNIVKVTQKQQHIVVQGIGGQPGKTGPVGPAGADGKDGKTGPVGPAGADGKDGKDGADGFSPTASVEQTSSGATITITDKDGTTTATVNNGATKTSELTNDSDFQTGTQVAQAVGTETTARQDADTNLQNQINTINGKIPAQASTSNQLADKSFVNSSIATNTAYYISDNGQPFQSVADLEAYSGTLTNNDYAFVVGTDSAGNTTYTRYKYNAQTQEWSEEYVLNNSSFTSEQWAAISSGITSGLVDKLTNLANITSIGKNLALNSGVLSCDGGAETTSTATPSSSFTLDALSGSPISLSIYGDTYQQTYTGKNLIGFANVTSGTSGTGNGVTYNLSNTKVVANGTTTGSSNIIPRSSTGISLPAGTYTVSFNKVSGSYSRPGAAATAFYIRTSGGTLLAETFMNRIESGVATPTTFTLTETTLIAIEMYANTAGQVFNNFEFTAQIEAGSTATSYEPYVGGVPSPNPDCPQAVQVVTGEQTVTITDGASESQAFAISLGSIELCKIGSYQDYIYKNNGNWYIHKELASRNLSANTATDNWNREASGSRYYANRGATYYGGVGGSSDKLCSHASNDTSDSPYFLLGNAQYFQFRNANSTWASLDAFLTWLTSNTVMAYYPLATATDTQITDTVLIGQLEAISLYSGTNSVVVTSSNLPGLLQVSAYADTINGNFKKIYDLINQ